MLTTKPGSRGWLNSNERDVDVNTWHMCKDVHHNNHIASTCRSMSIDSIFQYGIKFYWKGQKIKLSREFEAIVAKYWYNFGVSSYDYICTLGLVPVRLSKIPGTQDRVPVVVAGIMGYDFRITVRVDHKTGLKVFQFYRLRNKKNGQIIQPTLDRKVTIMSDFGYDPDETGKLTSIVASILVNNYFLNRIRYFTLRAENNRSDPTIFTEVPENVAPVKPSDYYDFYGDRDRAGSEAQGRYQLNVQEIIQAHENQKMIQEYNDTENGESGDQLYKKQQRGNIYTLPIGHRVARHDLPESRNDWNELNRHEENIIASAYQVPRSLIISDTGMSTTSVSLTKETFTNNINKVIGI